MNEPGELIPINGRPAWLTDDTPLAKITYKDGDVSNPFANVATYHLSNWFNRSDDNRIVAIRLPANDPYYAILAAGLPLFDGKTGFIPWRGGDEAPADYGGRVLIRARSILPYSEGWRWRHIGRVGDIIAYEPTQAAQPVSDEAEPIDWQHPENLELVRKDGTGEALPVVPDREFWPDQFGYYMLAVTTPDNWRFFKESGENFAKKGAYRIRNKRTKAVAEAQPDPWTPELKDRALAFIRREADKGETTAKALLAEIEPEPVDPLQDVIDAVVKANFAVDTFPADDLRAELAKRGGRIVFEGDE